MPAKPSSSRRPRKPVSVAPMLPVIPLRDVVTFPGCISPLFLQRIKSMQALEEAVQADKKLVLIAQKSADEISPTPADLYTVGVVAEVLQVLKMPDGTAKILVEGQQTVRIIDVADTESSMRATVENIDINTAPTKQREALVRLVLRQFERYAKLSDKVPDEIFITVRNIEDPLSLTNSVAHYVGIKTRDKQSILESDNLDQRMLLLSQHLTHENEMLEVENKLLTQVKSQIGRSQKEFFLTEQLKAIERELGIGNEEDAELDELGQKIERSRMSDEARERANRELGRLSKMAPLSPEATVSRTYIEMLLELPWGRFTKDKTDLARAQRVLDDEHYGLQKVKERIVEHLAVHALTKRAKGPILCLVGPPGVGKTSLARSIARALGRKFVRISLGGVRDEAEIRGHRRTYIGSLPGKIIQAVRKAGSMNPVILLDEVDKMSSDFRGDPASAMLEVLDPEQNVSFSDHYLEVDFDLSHTLFITTANSQSDIPLPLLDRLEVVRLSGYTEDEKLEIAQRHLVPKQVRNNGLTPKQAEFAAEAINAVIQQYTREAGVRNLEREIATICRRIAKDIVKSRQENTERTAADTVDAKRIRTILGPPRFKDMELEKQPEVGVATGLAWTEVGGELLPAEVTIMKGRGNLVLTGKLGDVMQESAKAALSWIRSRAEQLKIPADFHKNLDIHIHVPEGAIPKDGPSAGITMTTSLVSALTNTPVRQDIAMTGEVTLRGKVLKIGGLKEKTLAAHRTGIRTVIVPEDNRDDLEDMSAKIRDEMTFIFVDHVQQVLDIALVTKSTKAAGSSKTPRGPRRRPTGVPASTAGRRARRP